MNDNLATRIDEAIGFVKSAHEKAKNGEVTSLSEFHEEVAQICADIQQGAADGDSAGFATKLGELQTSLSELEAEFQKRKGEVEVEFRKLNAQQKGHTSYQTVQHSGDKKEN